MKEFFLRDGTAVLVDDDVYEWASKKRWRLTPDGYVVRTAQTAKGPRVQFLHRIVAKTPDGKVTDHINLDKLDNRRANLRACTLTENNRNRRVQQRSASGARGVYWRERKQKWEVKIWHNGRSRYIGEFFDKDDAAKAWNEVALKLHGPFACLNPLSS